jgi:CBS domain containing-hemolysin-like protein
VTLLVGLFAAEQPLEWGDLGLALAVGAPVLLLLTEGVAGSLGQHRAEGLLRYTLPLFHVLQIPLGLLVAGLAGLQGMLLRLLHVPARPPADERIVEDLRGVIEESAIEEPLGPAQRELIENVMALADVALAAIMTPRTEIHGLEVHEPLESAVRAFAEHGHSRVPVYQDTIDTIIGTIHALDLTRGLSTPVAERPALRELMRPAYFVPDTKRVSELLSELRTRKRKMAIVLDEYGGTAGVVTLTDLLAEVVGEIQGEHQDRSERIVRNSDGSAEVEAGLHVSEVNEALGLSIPEEEDYETLGGFVLSEFGRFPREGEHFRHGNAEFSVVEASDRRVLKVGVRQSA